MDTYQRLLEVCATVFEGEMDVAIIKPESNLREDLAINSIGLLYMAMAIEQEFGIKFNNDDFKQLVTVADVVAIIDKKSK